jgi:hypothetical protein
MLEVASQVVSRLALGANASESSHNIAFRVHSEQVGQVIESEALRTKSGSRKDLRKGHMSNFLGSYAAQRT